MILKKMQSTNKR